MNENVQAEVKKRKLSFFDLMSSKRLMRYFNLRQIITTVLLTLSCCSAIQAQPDHWNSTPADPYENYNRQMYQFNKGLDIVFFKPIAFLYKRIIPCPVTKAVSNFFNNLGELVTIPNDILQGNMFFAATDTTRFVINTTFGIGGLIDVATCGGLPRHVEDTGLTFARWGYKCSHYLVLPILGPSTVRDTLGLPFDYYLFSPYPYIPYTRSFEARLALAALYGIDKRSQLLDFDETINQAAVDPYVFIRDAYLQRRNFLIATNEDQCNNINIQNENMAVTSEAEDVYIPGDEDQSGTKQASADSDDIYVPAEEEKSPTKNSEAKDKKSSPSK